MTAILGINAYHGDSAACLVLDGRLSAAAEEERFRRIKHWAGFPSRAIRYCLEEARLGLEDVDHVALNQDPRANLWRKFGYTLAHRPKFGMVLERLRNQQRRASVSLHLSEAFPSEHFRAQVHAVEHHLAHLSSAFHVCGFEDAVAVSVDGFGDFASAAWGCGQGTRLRVDGRVCFPHSLGIFYQALTQYLGFPHYGDEYKVMGLAPYGKPRFMEEMGRILRLQEDGTFRLALEFFRHHRHKIDYQWNGGSPIVGPLFSDRLIALLGPPRHPGDPLENRHRDLAHSLQASYEAAFFHLLNRLHARYQLDRLALAGGCAMNSVANGKVHCRTPFKKVYVQAAAGDAGGALGAAMVVWRRSNRGTPAAMMDHAYWGPQFSDNDVASLLRRRAGEVRAQGCRMQHLPEKSGLCERAARAIAEGRVVGWFQGRMEWGPRALGNRSIVCDPRRPDMKDILNLKIKRRESFRPFAPSILREAVAEWFETEDDVPFMTEVFQIRQERRGEIPAVTHVDGSGRLQTVHRHTNPLYYSLIEAFRDLTGVPILLNTSFNENEPVVCRPEEALECFLRTQMDLLVMGQHLIERLPDRTPNGAEAAELRHLSGVAAQCRE
jgi:carbamoyltransferase